jgi:hypothetical protein
LIEVNQCIALHLLYSALAALLALGTTSAIAQPGSVLSHQKISDTEGGFAGVLDTNAWFGSALAVLGDLDRDGIEDLAVGTFREDDGGADRGAVWVLFLNSDGTVKSHQKISDTEGGFTGMLDDFDFFGISVAALGDQDGDGVADLAAGAEGDDDGSAVLNANRGAVWVLFLNSDGTVKSHQKISHTEGRFTGGLDDLDFFGRSVSALGDVDRDGITDLVVGAAGDSDGGPGHGALWVLFMNSDGTVKAHQKISDTEGGFTAELDSDDFGGSITAIGDLDGDGVTDVAAGAKLDDDGGVNHGAVWVLFLNSDGTVKSHQKISDTEGGFTGVLGTEWFGTSVTALDDLDGDGVTDLAVGAMHDNDGGTSRGAVWVLFLNSDATVKGHQKISDTEGGFTGVLGDGDFFGRAVTVLGDLNNDDITDLAVGAIGDDDGGSGAFADRGAIWVLFLDNGQTVTSSGDLNGDGDVDGFDLALLLGQWTGTASYRACPPHIPADLNVDCKVNGFDLALLLGAWD